MTLSSRRLFRAASNMSAPATFCTRMRQCRAWPSRQLHSRAQNTANNARKHVVSHPRIGCCCGAIATARGRSISVKRKLLRGCACTTLPSKAVAKRDELAALQRVHLAPHHPLSHNNATSKARRPRCPATTSNQTRIQVIVIHYSLSFAHRRGCRNKPRVKYDRQHA